MEANKILTSDFLDILFEGRNKEYGAYQLRTTYAKRIWMALGITLLSGALIAGAVVLKGTMQKKKDEKMTMNEQTIQEIQQEEKKPDELPPPPPPPPKQEPPPKVEMKAFTPPKVVKDEEVKEPPPQVEELKDTKIGTVNQEGVKDLGIVAPPVVVDAGKGIVEVKKPEPEPEIFTKVEIDAQYPGGPQAWKNFLTRNLRAEVASDNGATSGNYTVLIKFVVDVAGNVSDITPLTNNGYGMEQEAVRVLKKSGKWTPAQQNGRYVKAYRQQPITFQIAAE
jgi:protein TonB